MVTKQEYESLSAVCKSYQNEVDELRKKLNEVKNGFKLYVIECVLNESLRVGINSTIFFQMKDIIGTMEDFIEKAKTREAYMSSFMKDQKRQSL